MSTEVILRCNFCGNSSVANKVFPIDFMGENEDFHICGGCTAVIGNLLYDVSSITKRNPEDTVLAGPEGLAKIIKRLSQTSEIY